MEETYNRIRLEIKAVDAMIGKAKDKTTINRLQKRKTKLKQEAHEVLLAVHATQTAVKSEAKEKEREAEKERREHFVKSLHGVLFDMFPARIRIWASNEAARRIKGESGSKAGTLKFWLVLFGLVKN